MAVTFLCGFDGQAVGVDSYSSLSGTAGYATAIKRTGTASLRCNPASGASGYMVKSGAHAGWVHGALYIATLPSVARVIWGDTTDGLTLNPSGTVEYFDSGVSKGASSALSTATWYWIGLDTATAGSVARLQVDGVTVVTSDMGSNNIGDLGCTGIEASAIDIYWDDVILDNAGFLAPSKVALLLPISDNARASLWTGGAGGTTNLFDAVNNTPPIGTATETDLTQIEHAGGAAGTTDAYDANMTSYTTAGIATGDTVLAVQLVAAHGEDVTTGAKLLAFSVVSNPAIAATGNITAGDATPALLGTYPSEWGHHFGTLTTSPSVTLGTSPVMRALRPETATRVASVCFMGITVAWTPAAAATRPLPLLVVSQAVPRASSW